MGRREQAGAGGRRDSRMNLEKMLARALTLIGDKRTPCDSPSRYARQVMRRYEAIVNPPTVRPLRCNLCRQMLPPDSFSVDRDKPNGRRPECRGCMKARRLERAERRGQVKQEARARREGAERARSAITRMAESRAAELYGTVGT